jgi:hypothetical protein
MTDVAARGCDLNQIRDHCRYHGRTWEQQNSDGFC